MIKKSEQPISRIFWFLASLKLAIFVIVGLALSLTTGTFLESLYDTPTAKFWVYQALWFRGLLALLGVNIFVVALSRWPWKMRHLPFLLAHAGILILLGGSWLTDRYGLDGSMRITEGEATSGVELDSLILYVGESGNMRTIPIHWLPPGVAFKPFTLASQGVNVDVTVDQYLSHADGDYHFVPARNPVPQPAAKVLVQGGPMRIKQEFWLWTGNPQWTGYQAGPAYFAIGEQFPLPPHGPRLQLLPQKDGSLAYKTISSSGETKLGRFAAGKVGGPIQANWKGGVTLTLSEWIPDARLVTSYKPSRVQYREMAPPSAIHLVTGKGADGTDVWLGLGERAILRAGGREVELGFFRRQVVLPFSLQLDRFTIERYEGSMSPSSYASKVTLLDPRDPKAQRQVEISMNEPLKHGGITFYQASYEDAMPRPVTSIFSVNRDPGRPWKYAGSLLIVLGSILLFAVKMRRARLAQQQLLQKEGKAS